MTDWPVSRPGRACSDDLARRWIGDPRLPDLLLTDVCDTVREGGARFAVVAGPRGVGKSHLLALVVARLRERLPLVVALPEDAPVVSLADLLARTLAALPEADGLPPPAVQLEALRAAPPDEAERRALGMVRARLGDAPLVLVVDRLDQALAALGRDGQARLRGVLQSRGNWTVLGAARRLGDDFLHADSPFFHAFGVTALAPPSASACARLVPEAALLHLLLGGVPADLLRVAPLLDRGVEGAFAAFAELVLPEIRAELDGLPPGQRAVIEALLAHGRPLSVGEIAARTFATHQSTSSQLRYLSRDGRVQATAVGRERFYEVSDRRTWVARCLDPALLERVREVAAGGELPEALRRARGDARELARLSAAERGVVAHHR